MTTVEQTIIKLQVIQQHIEDIENEIHAIEYDYCKTGEKRQAYDYKKRGPKVDENGNPVIEDVWDFVQRTDDELSEEDKIKLEMLNVIKDRLSNLVCYSGLGIKR